MIDPGRAPGQTLSRRRPTFLDAKLDDTPNRPIQWDSKCTALSLKTLPANAVPHIQTPVWDENRSMRSAVSFIHPRDEILQAIQRIYRYRMTTTSGGNLSIREDNGDIWITPARLDKGSLRREDIVRV